MLHMKKYLTMNDNDDASAIRTAVRLFRTTFSDSPTVAGAAPGRVNLIGEHVDYNDGFVFPLALQKNTYIVAAPQKSSSMKCEVISDAYPNEIATFTPGDSPLEASAPNWISYVKGMTALYQRNIHPVTPFRAAIVSTVPQGGGLGSSAALEMATAIILEVLADLTVDLSERAKMGQSCEHEFAGVPCGIMDQLISSRAIVSHALLIDCRSLEATPVPLDDPDTVIVIANSRVAHELSGSEYLTRSRQCDEAAAAIAAHFPDQHITHLRDCTEEMLQAVESNLQEVTAKRALHVICEDKRTLEAKDCLENGDLERVGTLMHASHVSLRDLFEVSTTEIDALVDIAMSINGVYGSRITGGGFGGCTVTLVRKGSVEELVAAFHFRYPEVSGGVMADVFVTQAGGGARNLTDLIT